MRYWLSGGIFVAIVALCSIALAQQSFYSIHVSSHKQQAPAAEEVKKLKSKGLDAFMRHVAVQDKGMWYRIFIGKYATQKAAADEMKRLKNMKVSDYFAVKKLSGEKAAEGAAATTKKAPAKAKPRAASHKSGNYYLFVGFYRDFDSALKEVNRLNTALKPYGNHAFSTRETVADGTNYRVYIGTFADLQQASASGEKLKNQKLLTSFFVPVQTTQDMISGRMPAAAADPTQAVAPAVVDKSPQSGSVASSKEAGQEKSGRQAAEKKSATAGPADRGYTVMLKGGAFFPQDIDDFSVTNSTTRFRISDDAAAQLGVEGSLRFNKNFSIYGNIDTVFISGIDWFNFSAGPVLTFQASDSLRPYVKGGGVFGNFSWDGPGDFDQAFGWEVGTGVHFLESKYRFGIEFAYRDLSFDYNLPNDPTVSASDDSLDMSGYSVMATFSYWF